MPVTLLSPLPCPTDGTPIQVQESCMAQAALQATSACRGGLLPDDAALQPAQVSTLDLKVDASGGQSVFGKNKRLFPVLLLCCSLSSRRPAYHSS